MTSSEIDELFTSEVETVLNNKKLLIIDDQPGVRQMLQEVFMAENMDVLLAASGREAFEVLQKQEPDLILLDMKMPEMTGVEFLQQLRAKDINYPVILMSAYGEHEINQEKEEIGILEHVTKPFDLQEIINAVNRAFSTKDAGSKVRK